MGISREVVYLWRREDSDFSMKFDEINSEITERLEASAFQRAVEGVEKDIYYKGIRIGFTRDYSDVLTMFLLKARNPEKYNPTAREKEIAQEVSREISTKVAAVIKSVIPDVCPECRNTFPFKNTIANKLHQLSTEV
ncbi:hypothetical protein BVX98_07635 [bacterium F11]|nr:hypothetical protein BVX98_07635 [bacterium F11]